LKNNEGNKNKVIAIVGPTGSGKTALSLVLAHKLEAEIVACDSRTIYRYLNIGTAKPTVHEIKDIPHHLIDIINPDEQYTVAQYRRQAQAIIDNIFARGKIPIICGGTGLYARALLEGLSIPNIAPQPELRETFTQFANEHGNQALHACLEKIDPVTAKRLNINDRFRIIRALEVSTVSNKPFSQLIGKGESPYNVLWIGLNANDRNYLHEQIKQRFKLQLEAGLVNEVESLYKKYGPIRSLVNTVNYQEFVQYIEGKFTLEQAIAEAVKHNCQLARRQIMWFRSNNQMNWFAIDDKERTLADAVNDKVQTWLQ
jgi:tRNA dimethylallyltransferase